MHLEIWCRTVDKAWTVMKIRVVLGNNRDGLKANQQEQGRGNRGMEDNSTEERGRR